MNRLSFIIVGLLAGITEASAQTPTTVVALPDGSSMVFSGGLLVEHSRNVSLPNGVSIRNGTVIAKGPRTAEYEPVPKLPQEPKDPTSKPPFCNPKSPFCPTFGSFPELLPGGVIDSAGRARAFTRTLYKNSDVTVYSAK